MLTLDYIFGTMENIFSYISTPFFSLKDILVNTWESEDNPFRGFSFGIPRFAPQSGRYWSTHLINTFHQLSSDVWITIDKHCPKCGPNLKAFGAIIERNYRPMGTALVYVGTVWLTLKILWSCLTWLCARPDRAEAKRWFSQAELDHQASQNDMNDDNPAYEWVCYKCQQATEKSIKAALLSRKGRRHLPKSGHDLAQLCEPLRDPTLNELVGTLHTIIGVTSRMRYPDILPHPKVPHDVYSGQEASNAWEMTGQILQHIHQNYIS